MTYISMICGGQDSWISGVHQEGLWRTRGCISRKLNLSNELKKSYNNNVSFCYLRDKEKVSMYESFKSFKFDTYVSQACLYGLSRYLSREEAGLHQIFS